MLLYLSVIAGVLFSIIYARLSIDNMNKKIHMAERNADDSKHRVSK